MTSTFKTIDCVIRNTIKFIVELSDPSSSRAHLITNEHGGDANLETFLESIAHEDLIAVTLKLWAVADKWPNAKTEPIALGGPYPGTTALS